LNTIAGMPVAVSFICTFDTMTNALAAMSLNVMVAPSKLMFWIVRVPEYALMLRPKQGREGGEEIQNPPPSMVIFSLPLK
jgi:hypothetical protein